VNVRLEAIWQAAVLVEPSEYMQDKAAQLLQHVGHGMRRSEA